MFTLLQMVMTTGVQEQFTMGWVVTMREKRKIQNMKNCMDKHRKKRGGGGGEGKLEQKSGRRGREGGGWKK